MSYRRNLAEYIGDRDFITGYGPLSAERYPDMCTREDQVVAGLSIALLVGPDAPWESVEQMASDLGAVSDPKVDATPGRWARIAKRIAAAAAVLEGGENE